MITNKLHYIFEVNIAWVLRGSASADVYISGVKPASKNLRKYLTITIPSALGCIGMTKHQVGIRLRNEYHIYFILYKSISITLPPSSSK
jgi:hypothetical protein